MRCSKAQELMSFSLDGEASLEQTRQMEAHIQSCALCSRRWAGLRTVSDLLQSAPMATPAGGFVDIVMRRVEALEPAPTRRHSFLALGTLIGLVVLCAIAAGNMILIAGTYALTLSDVPVFPLDNLASAAWKLFPVLRVFTDIAWDVAVRVFDVGQGTVFLAMVSASLGLAALWAHLLKSYPGVKEVG